MCGIVGYIGKNDCFDYILDGLKQLQNRGYDSAGLCTIFEKDFKITKFASDNESALTKIERNKNKHNKCKIGIGHTRWATHGEKNDINSHPHNDMYDNFSVVHNGIIENYSEIKNFLIKENFCFKSQTDTEVIVNLISYYYQKRGDGDVLFSIKEALSELQGTYALCILFKNETNKIYLTRKGSPLNVGINDDFAMISSENSGFCNLFKSYISVDNNDICILTNHDEKFNLVSDKKYEEKLLNHQEIILTPDPYPHWTLKEIYEQPISIQRAISFGGRVNNDEIKLGGLECKKDILKEINNLILLGCGTSLYAAQIGCYFLKEFCNFNTVQVFDGSEFCKNDIPKVGKTALIFLSQSGETRDLFESLKLANEFNLITIGIINVVDSYIAKEVDCGVYLNAGREVGVASTKSFTSQVIILKLISLWFAKIKEIKVVKKPEIIKSMYNLSYDIKSVIENNRDKVKMLAEKIKDKKSLFLLGKNSNEYYAKEGSLKLKEIGYIHSEAYNSSALKHGPYSLLEEDFPVIIFLNRDEFYEKNLSIIEEIKSRKGFVIVISEMIPEKCDFFLQINNNKSFKGLLSVILIQLLSYELSIIKGIDPDKPRNLAKVVTTD
jgi:glucosamine--fructose-6-phosphate aminotransferase (isomerizing)